MEKIVRGCVSSFWLLRRVVLLLGQQRLLGPAFAFAERGREKTRNRNQRASVSAPSRDKAWKNETQTYELGGTFQNCKRHTKKLLKEKCASQKQIGIFFFEKWSFRSQKKYVRLLSLLLLGRLGRLALAEANVAVGERTENRRAETENGLARQRVPAPRASGRGDAETATKN